jgi:SHS2 domain-containing protein
MGFKFLPHTADVKIVVEEKSLEKAFITSALALKEVIIDKIKINSKIKKEIRVEGKDKEALLLEFLQEFLYLVDAKDFILSKISSLTIKKDKKDLKLNAVVMGDNSLNYKFTNEVKAVTYNDMFVKEEKNKTTIQFVLDV